MPNALTHSYIAEQTFLALPKSVQDAVRPYRRLYDLGCLGPDLLMGLVFNDDFDKKNAGERLHTEFVYAGFKNGADYCREHPSDRAVYAYLLGSLTHYAADSTIHPYVYEYVEHRMRQKFDPILNGCLHTIVETEMDVYVGHYFLKGKKADTFWRFRFLPRYLKTMVRYFLDVNREIFHVPLTRFEAYLSALCFGGMAFVCQRHKNGVMRYNLCKSLDKRFKAEHLLMAALRPRTLNPRYDYLNMAHQPYPAVYLYDKENTVSMSFPEMVDEAIVRGVNLIQKAVRQIETGEPMPLSDFFVNYNGQVNKEAYSSADAGKFRESSIPALVEEQLQQSENGESEPDGNE